MKFAIFVLGVFAYSAIVSARPNDIKNVFVEDNEIPADKKILKKGVSASFGGYQASAGLGGGPGGGGLFASAGIPEAGASAGVGGYGNAGASAGASSGFDYGQQRPPLQNGNGNGFFDRIFAIPINVLQSVNEYVKTKGKGTRKSQQGQGVYIENGSGSAGATASQNGVAAASASIGGTPDFNTRFAGAGSSEEASVASSQASASAGAYAGSSASAGVGSPSGFRPAGPGGKPDYDRIFNIPISALKSVNDFLNG